MCLRLSSPQIVNYNEIGYNKLSYNEHLVKMNTYFSPKWSFTTQINSAITNPGYLTNRFCRSQAIPYNQVWLYIVTLLYSKSSTDMEEFIHKRHFVSKWLNHSLSRLFLFFMIKTTEYCASTFFLYWWPKEKSFGRRSK